MRRGLQDFLTGVMNAAHVKILADTREWMKTLPDPNSIPDEAVQEHLREKEEEVFEALVKALAEHDGTSIKEARRVLAEATATADQMIAKAKDEQDQQQ